MHPLHHQISIASTVSFLSFLFLPGQKTLTLHRSDISSGTGVAVGIVKRPSYFRFWNKTFRLCHPISRNKATLPQKQEYTDDTRILPKPLKKSAPSHKAYQRELYHWYFTDATIYKELIWQKLQYSTVRPVWLPHDARIRSTKCVCEHAVKDYQDCRISAISVQMEST